MDKDGYPEEDELKAIREWPHADQAGWFAFVKDRWAYPNYWTELELADDPAGLQGRGRYRVYFISTAGWSGNEDMIRAMEQNRILWVLTWYSSRRGGHYEFRARP